MPTALMTDGVRWFAENQLFTPFIETLRGLLLGTPSGNSGLDHYRLVHRHHAGGLPVGAVIVQPQINTLA